MAIDLADVQGNCCAATARLRRARHFALGIGDAARRRGVHGRPGRRRDLEAAGHLDRRVAARQRPTQLPEHRRSPGRGCRRSASPPALWRRSRRRSSRARPRAPRPDPTRAAAWASATWATARPTDWVLGGPHNPAGAPRALAVRAGRGLPRARSARGCARVRRPSARPSSRTTTPRRCPPADGQPACTSATATASRSR